VTGEGLNHLQGLKKLRCVWVNKLQIADAVVAALKHTLPHVKIRSYADQSGGKDAAPAAVSTTGS
jgi:hypothetical protein